MLLKLLCLLTIGVLTTSTENNCPAASTTKCQSKLDKLSMLEKYLKINEERSVQLDQYFDDFKKQIKKLNEESNSLLKDVLETVLLSDDKVSDEEVRQNQNKLELEIRNLREEMEIMRQNRPETSTQAISSEPKIDTETNTQPTVVVTTESDKKVTTQPEVVTQQTPEVNKKVTTQPEVTTQQTPEACGDSAKLPKDCLDVLSTGKDTSGAYCIRPKSTPIMVFCDMESRDGGWTVIQNRFDGSQNFSLGWKQYQQGFGNILEEFWLGLDHIFDLTDGEDNDLLINLVARNRTEAYAFFGGFNIGDEAEGYNLKLLEQYEGTAGNSLGWQRLYNFSTVDHVEESVRDCVTKSEGGWWFRPPPIPCKMSNLNGRYYEDGVSPGGGTGINWYKFGTDGYSLVASRMMVRRQTVFFSRDRQVCKNSENLPKDCLQVMEKGNQKSGPYCIRPKSKPVMVLCDMDSLDGGWTLVQNRFDGSQNFSLGWKEYQQGFGNISGEFWLGLDHLHHLTENGKSELLVKLVDRDHKEAFAYFHTFGIGSEAEEYNFKFLDGYNGTAGNSMVWQRDHNFSTIDHGHESTRGCVKTYEGGWWFHPSPLPCMHSNLNGRYISDGSSSDGTGINWHQFSTDEYSLLASKMMVRRRKE